jgi:Flp pilus assembly protein TadG
MTALRSRFKRHTRGQSIVELALCTPLLMLIMLGTIDFGRVFFDYIQMRNAVVEGATYGTRHPADTSGIQTAAMENNVPGDTVITTTISGDCSKPQGGGSVTVEADHTFTPMFFTTLSTVASSVDWSFNVHAASTMRCMT